MTTETEWLLVPEVARIARASVRTVYWWMRTGRLPSSRPGRRVLVKRADLDAFLAHGARGAGEVLASR